MLVFSLGYFFIEDATAYTSTAIVIAPTINHSQLISNTHSSAMKINISAHKAKAIPDFPYSLFLVLA